MPLSATLNYTPKGVIVVEIVMLIIEPLILTYDKPPPIIVVDVQCVVDMLFSWYISTFLLHKYILNNFNFQDFRPFFQPKVLISKSYYTHTTPLAHITH